MILLRRHLLPDEFRLPPLPVAVAATGQGANGGGPPLPLRRWEPLLASMMATAMDWFHDWLPSPVAAAPAEMALTQQFASGSAWVTNRWEIEQLLEYGAEHRMQVTLIYRHVVDGKTVRNRLEPYSYRYRRSRAGPGTWKFFFGFHPAHGSIESYLVANIDAARLTGKRYAARWPVELESNL